MDIFRNYHNHCCTVPSGYSKHTSVSNFLCFRKNHDLQLGSENGNTDARAFDSCIVHLRFVDGNETSLRTEWPLNDYCNQVLCWESRQIIPRFVLPVVSRELLYLLKNN